MKDETELLQAAKNLDQEALTTIFDLYAPAIYRYALRFRHDPIESDRIVGEVFAQLLEKLALGKSPLTNLRSYLYQIAYHLVINRMRHNQHSAHLEVAIDASDRVKPASIQTQAEARVLTDVVVSSLNEELNELQRHVIILRFLEDFSLRETAAIIGKKVNHVKVIQSRGLAKLRRSVGLRSESTSSIGNVTNRPSRLER